MLFGAKARFGIECELQSFTEPQQPIWGSIWLWAGGQRLGEAPSYVDVGLVAVAVCSSLLYRSRRKDEASAGKDKGEIWRRISQSLLGFNKDGTTDWTMQQDQKFLICGAIEGFDNTFGILVEDSDSARFIWRSYAWTEQARAMLGERIDESVHEVILNPDEYESVVESFLDWLETETGFRPEIRNWVELSEEQRETIRQEIINRRPGLARADRRAELDGMAMRELAQRRSRESLEIKGIRAPSESIAGPPD